MIERKTIGRENLTIDTTQSRSPGWQGDDQDERLKESIKNTGILSALLVRPIESASYEPKSEAEYAVIAGSRRYRAGRKAGKQEFPCKVVDVDDIQAAILSYKENEERKDLTLEEKADSIKLQYEALRPTTPDGGVWECPEDGCQLTSETSNGLEQHLQEKHIPEKMGIYLDNPCSSSVTDEQAVKRLANKHFPDLFNQDGNHNGIQRVNRLIDVALLPPDLRALYKDPKDRTDAEKKKLAQKGVPEDRVLSGSFQGASASILSLHNELQSVDGVDATERVLETVAELDAGQSSNQLGDRVRAVKDDVIEQVGASESAAENQQVVSDTIQKHRDTLIEQTDGISDSLTKDLTFRFSNNKYSVYHARAKEMKDEDHHSALVRGVYEEWLEEVADKNDW
jgi:hypothetical protein